jgi:hypothetical protein
MAMLWSRRGRQEHERDPALAYAEAWRQMSRQMKSARKYFVLVDYRLVAEAGSREEAFRMRECFRNLRPESWTAVWMSAGEGGGTVALCEVPGSQDPARLRWRDAMLERIESAVDERQVSEKTGERRGVCRRVWGSEKSG